jgi:hypothetical protein
MDISPTKIGDNQQKTFFSSKCPTLFVGLLSKTIIIFYRLGSIYLPIKLLLLLPYNIFLQNDEDQASNPAG